MGDPQRRGYLGFLHTVTLSFMLSPTATPTDAEKAELYQRCMRLKLSTREPEEHGIGSNIFPTPYPLPEMPEDTFENRIFFLDLLAANSLTAVNTTSLLPVSQRVSYRVPGTTSFAECWEPQRFSLINYIFTKTGFKNAFLEVGPRHSWACDDPTVTETQHTNARGSYDLLTRRCERTALLGKLLRQASQP